LVIVADSISFQLPIAQLPISVADCLGWLDLHELQLVPAAEIWDARGVRAHRGVVVVQQSVVDSVGPPH